MFKRRRRLALLMSLHQLLLVRLDEPLISGINLGLVWRLKLEDLLRGGLEMGMRMALLLLGQGLARTACLCRGSPQSGESLLDCLE